MFGWLAPNDPRQSGRTLAQCSCGRVMWMDAPQEVKRWHDGHHMQVCMNASLWVFIKMKMGWLDRLTWTERRQRRLA